MQIKLHDKRWQSNNKNRSQTSLGDSSGNSQSSEHSGSRQILHWTSDILAGDQYPTIEYKKDSLNLKADSLLRLRTGEHYEHNTPLHNTEPIILKKKAEVNMVTTLDLQIRVRDILKTLDKCQLIINAEKVLDSLDPAKLRELQDRDQSIINLKNSRQ